MSPSPSITSYRRSLVLAASIRRPAASSTEDDGAEPRLSDPNVFLPTDLLSAGVPNAQGKERILFILTLRIIVVSIFIAAQHWTHPP